MQTKPSPQKYLFLFYLIKVGQSKDGIGQKNVKGNAYSNGKNPRGRN